jgi:hypothetical protein
MWFNIYQLSSVDNCFIKHRSSHLGVKPHTPLCWWIYFLVQELFSCPHTAVWYRKRAPSLLRLVDATQHDVSWDLHPVFIGLVVFQMLCTITLNSILMNLAKTAGKKYTVLQMHWVSSLKHFIWNVLEVTSLLFHIKICKKDHCELLHINWKIS